MKDNLQKTKDRLTHSSHFRELCFLRLVPCMGGLFLLYIAFLGVNLSNVLERSNTLGKISTFKRDHALVEQKYLSLVENLDREQAQQAYGLVEIKDVYFATASSFALGYSDLSHNVR
jgi:hypothetical protein